MPGMIPDASTNDTIAINDLRLACRSLADITQWILVHDKQHFGRDIRDHLKTLDLVRTLVSDDD